MFGGIPGNWRGMQGPGEVSGTALLIALIFGLAAGAVLFCMLYDAAQRYTGTP